MIIALLVSAFFLINSALAANCWRSKSIVGAAAGVALNPYLLHMSDTEENRKFWQHYLRLNRNNLLSGFRLVPDYALQEKKLSEQEYIPPPQHFQYSSARTIPKEMRIDINRYNPTTKSFPLDEAIKKHEYSHALDLIRSGARSSVPISQLLVDLVRNYRYPDQGHAKWVDYYHEQHYLILALYRAAGRDQAVFESLRFHAKIENRHKILSILDEIDNLDRRWE